MKKAVIIVLGMLLAIIMVLLFRLDRFYAKVYNPKKNAPTLAPDKTVFNILFMGYGGANHDGAYLTDTLMVIHMDLVKNKVLLVSIPRDIWVKIPTVSGNSFHSKINALYEMERFPKDFPDVDNTKSNDSKTYIVSNTVSQITGLPIDYYMGVDFAGFTKSIDKLGGIDLTVQKSFTDPQYPMDGHEDDLCGKDEQFKQIEPFLNQTGVASPEAQDTKEKLLKEKPELDEMLKNATEEPELAFPCRYETLSFTAGLQHMSGAQVLKFARSRHAPQDGGDFARARRQQLVIEAIKDKALKITSIPKLLSLMDDLENEITTDIPKELLNKFLAESKDAAVYKISNLVLSDNDYLDYSNSPDGQSILIPKAGSDSWDVVKSWINDTISGVSLTPTAKPAKK